MWLGGARELRSTPLGELGLAGLGVALSSKEARVCPSALGALAHCAETRMSFVRLHKTCASSQACLF